MTPLEIKKLIEVKKQEIKELGLVDIINSLLFGKNVAINRFFWNRNFRGSLTEKESISSMFGVKSITTHKVFVQDRELEQIELQLESTKLAYSVEVIQPLGAHEIFSSKNGFFHLWADGTPVLTISIDYSGAQSKGCLSLREVRRFVKGPWTFELKKIAEKMDRFHAKQIDALKVNEYDRKTKWLLENFGIDEQELKVIKTPKKLSSKLTKLLNSFYKF